VQLNGLVAVLINNNGTENMHYALTDHLGSIIGLMNSSGSIEEEYSYDAWDRRRNATNWSYTGVPTTFLFDRGYTGHEHLDKFALINMNGRVYDPIVGRFLSADPFVQAPGNSQSYNRYSYCMNNPLAATDPSGYMSDPRVFWARAQQQDLENRALSDRYCISMHGYRPSYSPQYSIPTGAAYTNGGGGSGGFGGMVGFFYVGGEAVGVGSNGNGEGTQILENGNYLTSSGSEYLGSLGLSQSCGEIGQWKATETILGNDNNGSIMYNSASMRNNSNAYSYGLLKWEFIPKVDDFKNVWNDGGNVDGNGNTGESNNTFSTISSWCGVIGSAAVESGYGLGNLGVTVSYIGSGLSVISNFINVGNNLSSWSAHARLQNSIGIGAIGAIPYGGAYFSFILNGIDNTGGFDGIYNTIGEMQNCYNQTGMIPIYTPFGYPFIFNRP
jgi:RHS repeat-associated protein